jgi:NAD(P)H-nitrite reductase large subunit
VAVGGYAHGGAQSDGVGGSAMTCASTLRQEGFVGRVLMVTQEAVHPYDRTKLSKVLDSPVDKLLIRPVAYFEKYNIEILLSTQVCQS